MLVLVVEDDSALRQMFERILRRSGFEVEVAADGAEAFAIAVAILPGIVVTDVHLPRLNGPHLTRRLRDNNLTRDIPVIAISADEGSREDCMNAGCDAFLLKPVDSEQLIAALASHRA